MSSSGQLLGHKDPTTLPVEEARCQHRERVTTEQGVVCSECGLLLDEEELIVNYVPKALLKLNFETPLQKDSYTLHDLGIGTRKLEAQGNPRFARLNKVYLMTRVKDRRALITWLNGLFTFLSSENVPRAIKETCAIILRKILKKFKYRLPIKLMAHERYALYIVILEYVYKLHKTVFDTVQLRAKYKVSKSVYWKAKKCVFESGVLPVQNFKRDEDGILAYIGQKFNLSIEVIQTAKTILEEVRDKILIKPMSFYYSLIYISSILNNISLYQRAIAKHAGVNEITIRKHAHQILRALGVQEVVYYCDGCKVILFKHDLHNTRGIPRPGYFKGKCGCPPSSRVRVKIGNMEF